MLPFYGIIHSGTAHAELAIIHVLRWEPLQNFQLSDSRMYDSELGYYLSLRKPLERGVYNTYTCV